MDFWRFNRGNRPGISDLRELWEELLRELSEFLGIDLIPFHERIVEEEALVLTFRGSLNEGSPLDIRVEGVLLFQITADGDPYISSELMIFSKKSRLGLQSHSGESYLQLRYDKETSLWIDDGWLMDGDMEWIKLKTIREHLYSEFNREIELR